MTNRIRGTVWNGYRSDSSLKERQTIYFSLNDDDLRAFCNSINLPKGIGGASLYESLLRNRTPLDGVGFGTFLIDEPADFLVLSVDEFVATDYACFFGDAACDPSGG